jgi:hypothetical protein
MEVFFNDMGATHMVNLNGLKNIALKHFFLKRNYRKRVAVTSPHY